MSTTASDESADHAEAAAEEADLQTDSHQRQMRMHHDKHQRQTALDQQQPTLASTVPQDTLGVGVVPQFEAVNLFMAEWSNQNLEASTTATNTSLMGGGALPTTQQAPSATTAASNPLPPPAITKKPPPSADPLPLSSTKATPKTGRKVKNSLSKATNRTPSATTTSIAFTTSVPPHSRSNDPRFFHRDPILNPTEMELVWLAAESMYCFHDPECSTIQWEYVCEFASPALNAELRKYRRSHHHHHHHSDKKKVSNDDDEDDDKLLRKLVRMDDWLVSKRFAILKDHIMRLLIRGVRRPCQAVVIAQRSMQHRMRQNVS